jgi:hypothetical protein
MRKRESGWLGGLLLIAIGLFFLLNQFVDLPWLSNLGSFIVLGLGLFFLISGAVSRQDALMIPGGILTGIGLGIVLITGSFVSQGEDSGGVFIGAFALGWVLITVFSALFTDKTHWWALIPAAIMGLISAALLLQGPFDVALEWLGKLWPLLLIVGGIVVLYGAFKGGAKGGESQDLPETDEATVDKLKLR